MILMLNGAFGAGKTSLAQELFARRRDWMLFDPEEVGAMLWRLLDVKGDFQEIAAWAPLVVETARVLFETRRRPLVVPMTLVDPQNFATIRLGFEAIAPTRHFTLVASKETLERRLIERGADRWAFDQINRCVSSLERPEFGTHIDAERSVADLADEVLNLL